jgi:hypothetical protein
VRARLFLWLAVAARREARALWFLQISWWCIWSYSPAAFWRLISVIPPDPRVVGQPLRPASRRLDVLPLLRLQVAVSPVVVRWSGSEILSKSSRRSKKLTRDLIAFCILFQVFFCTFAGLGCNFFLYSRPSCKWKQLRSRPAAPKVGRGPSRLPR